VSVFWSQVFGFQGEKKWRERVFEGRDASTLYSCGYSFESDSGTAAGTFKHSWKLDLELDNTEIRNYDI
jgi:hypothetical protein